MGAVSGGPAWAGDPDRPLWCESCTDGIQRRPSKRGLCGEWLCYRCAAPPLEPVARRVPILPTPDLTSAPPKLGKPEKVKPAAPPPKPRPVASIKVKPSPPPKPPRPPPKPRVPKPRPPAPRTLLVVGPRREGVCCIEGCDRRPVKRGCCGRHYQAMVDAKRLAELPAPLPSIPPLRPRVERPEPPPPPPAPVEVKRGRGRPPHILVIGAPVEGVCVVVGCGRGVYQRHACEPHYRRLRRENRADELPAPRRHNPNGDAGVMILRAPVEGVCVVEGCDAPTRTRGCCENHYRRMLREGRADELPIARPDLDLIPTPDPGRCQIRGCEASVLKRGACAQHFNQLLKSGYLLPARSEARLCGAEGCRRIAFRGGLCGFHAHRKKVRTTH